jgi:hypothetical protein
VHLRQPNIEA